MLILWEAAFSAHWACAHSEQRSRQLACCPLHHHRAYRHYLCGHCGQFVGYKQTRAVCISRCFTLRAQLLDGVARVRMCISRELPQSRCGRPTHEDSGVTDGAAGDARRFSEVMWHHGRANQTYHIPLSHTTIPYHPKKSKYPHIPVSYQ